MMQRSLTSGVRGIRARIYLAPTRTYWVTPGNSVSFTQNSWKAMFVGTAHHGDEFYMLMGMLAVACGLCFYHCAVGTMWKKAELNSIFPISPDEACQKHASDPNWSKPSSQRLMTNYGKTPKAERILSTI